MGKSYADLMKQFGSNFKKSEPKLEDYGLNEASIKAMSSLPPEGFIAEMVKSLNKFYTKDVGFKKVIDGIKDSGGYPYKPRDTFTRDISKLLTWISSKLENKETAAFISTGSDKAATRILNALIKSLESAPAPKDVKVQPLSKSELDLFGIKDGKIPANFTKQDYNKAVNAFKDTEYALTLSDKAVDEYLAKFEKAYKEVVGDRPDVEMLTEAEAKLFKRDGKELSLKDINATIDEQTANFIAGAFIKKRSFNRDDIPDNEKEDYLTRFYNTIRDKKIKAKGSLSPSEEKWLNRDYVKKFVHSLIYPKARVEYLEKGEELSKGERNRLKRDDAFKSQIRPDDWFRTLEFTTTLLTRITDLVSDIDRVVDEDKVDKVVGGLKAAIPPIGEVESSIDRVEEVLTDMDLDKSAYTPVLRVIEGVYSPKIKEDTVDLTDKIKKLLVNLKAMKAEGKQVKDADFERAKLELINYNNQRKSLKKLNAIDLSRIKKVMEDHLNYIKSKREDLSKYENDMSRDIKDLAILNKFTDIRNLFRNLLKSEQFLVRWNHSTAITEKDKERVEELRSKAPGSLAGAVTPTAKSGSDFFKLREAMNVRKYTGEYNRLIGKLDSFGELKERIVAIADTIIPKVLSIIEWNPKNYNELTEEIAKLNPEFDEKDKKKAEDLLAKFNQVFSGLPRNKFYLTQDYVHNPYGGVGRGFKEVLEEVESLSKDIEALKLDGPKGRIEAVRDLLNNLENVRDWIKTGKKGEVDKSASYMFALADRIKKVAALILGGRRPKSDPPVKDPAPVDDPVPEEDDDSPVLIKKDEKPPRYQEKGRLGPRPIKPTDSGTLKDTKLKAFYDTIFHRKRGGPAGMRDVQNFFLEDTTKMAGKFMELLEKKGVSSIIAATDKYERELTELMHEIEKLKKDLELKGVEPAKDKNFIKLIESLKKMRDEYVQKTDISKQVEEAINEMTKKGRLEDHLANTAKLKYSEERDLKKNQAIIDEVRDAIRGKTDERGNVIEKGLEQELSEIKPKFIGQIEGLIDFIKEPMEHLKEAVVKEEGVGGDKKEKLTKDSESKKKALEELLAKASRIKLNAKLSLLDAIDMKGKGSDSYKDMIISQEVKDFLKKHKDSVAVIKNGQELPPEIVALQKELVELKSNPTEDGNKKIAEIAPKLKAMKDDYAKKVKKFNSVKESFLTEYNATFNTNHAEITPDFLKVMKLDFSSFMKGKATRLATIEKSLIKYYNKVTGENIDSIPTRQDIKQQWEKISDEPLDFDKLLTSKQLALHTLEELPEGVKKRILTRPVDVTTTWWYKAIQRDKSHHKTRWLDNLLKQSKQPITSDEEFDEVLSELSRDIGVATKEIDASYGRSKPYSTVYIDDLFNEQKQNVTTILNNADRKLNILPANKELEECSSVIYKAKNELNMGIISYGGYIFNLNRLKEYKSKNKYEFGDDRSVTEKKEKYLKKDIDKTLAEKNKKVWDSRFGALEAHINNMHNKARANRDSVNKQAEYLNKKCVELNKYIEDTMKNSVSKDAVYPNKKDILHIQNILTSYISSMKWLKETQDNKIDKIVGTPIEKTDHPKPTIAEKSEGLKAELDQGLISDKEYQFYLGQLEQEKVIEEHEKNRSAVDNKIKAVKEKVTKELSERGVSNIDPKYGELFNAELSKNKEYLGLVDKNKEIASSYKDKLEALRSKQIPGDPEQLTTKAKDHLDALVKKVTNKKRQFADEKAMLKNAAYREDNEWYDPEIADEETVDEDQQGVGSISKDISRSDTKSEVYNNFKKTINYLNWIIENYDRIKDKDAFDELLWIIHKLSANVPQFRGNISMFLKNVVIPGVQSLIKQGVEIPGVQKVVTNIEKAINTLDSLMEEYTTAKNNIKRRIEMLEKRHGDAMNKIMNSLDFINMDPDNKDYKVGDFIDFTEKEKGIIRKIFLRQVYKYLDTVWSKVQATNRDSMGSRYMGNYDQVWKAFSKYSGMKSNSKFMNILNTYKADIRASKDEKEISRIRLKSQELEEKLKKIYRGMHSLGIDPTRAPKDMSGVVKELQSTIDALKKKESNLDAIFGAMTKGVDMSYYSSLRENLIKNKDFVEDEDKEVETYMPASVEPPKKVDKVKAAEEKDKKELIAEVNTAIDKVADNIKGTSIPDDIDQLIAKAEGYIDTLVSMVSKNKTNELGDVEKLSYRNSPNFNANILYGRIMQTAIRNQLKMNCV